MKKFFAAIVISFFFNFAHADISMIQDMTSMWLHSYDPNDNAPWLHDDIPGQFWGNPDYTPDESYMKTFALWDLNMDGIVNMIDFSIYTKLDLETVLAKEEQKYKQCLCGPTLEDLVVIAECDLYDLRMIRDWKIQLEADVSFITCIIDSKQKWLDEAMYELGL